MRDSRCGTRIAGPIGDIQVFCRYKHTDLSIEGGVKVDLFECSASKGETPQHLFVLWSKLLHLFGQLVVHIFCDTRSSLLILTGFLTHNLCLHRTLCRKSLCNHLRLEFNGGFCQHRVVDPTGTIPRLCPFFQLQTQQVQSVYIGLFPLLTSVTIIVKIT